MKLNFTAVAILGVFASFESAVAQTGLIEFGSGSIASASDVNQNFSYLDDKIFQLEENLAKISTPTLSDEVVDCNAEGRDALQAKITEVINRTGRTRITATGTCSSIDIPTGNIQIFGNPTDRLVINQLETDTVTPPFVVYTHPSATVTFLHVNIDGGGANASMRNQGSTVYLGFTSIYNGTNNNLETLGTGFSAFFGPSQLGDDDDTATAASTSSGGVLAILDGRNIIQGLQINTLTLRGTGTALETRTGGIVYTLDPYTELDAIGGDVQTSHAGVLLLRNTTFDLSGAFYVTNTGTVQTSTESGERVSIIGDINIDQNAVFEINHEQSLGGNFYHEGSVNLSHGGLLRVKGDPADVNRVRLAATQDPIQTPQTIRVDSQALLSSNDAKIEADIDVTSGQVLVDNETNLNGGTGSSITTRFDGSAIFTVTPPSTLVSCEAGGSAWTLGETTSYCTPSP